MTDATHADDTTSVLDVRTTDLSQFDDGEAIRVHYRDATDEPSKTVTGRIDCRYSDTKVLIVTEDDRRLIVDLTETASEGGLRDFDTDETVGRPMFAESAYHVEKDGEQVREEVLSEDDEDEDEGTAGGVPIDPDAEDVTIERVANGETETLTGEEFRQAGGRRSTVRRLRSFKRRGIETQVNTDAIAAAADRGHVAMLNAEWWFVKDDDEWQRRFGTDTVVGPVLIEDYSEKAWKITGVEHTRTKWATESIFVPKRAVDVRRLVA